MGLDAHSLAAAVLGQRTSFVYQFGRSGGFCADYIRLLTRLIKCLQFGINFRLGRTRHPRGFAVEHGWRDYFLPFFEEADAPLLDWLNVHQFPYARRLPMIKQVVRPFLVATCQPRSKYFMFDDLGPLDHLGPPVFEVNQSFPSACRDVLRILWRYNPSTGGEVDAGVRSFKLPSSYVAVHIRRGDKLSEQAYIAVERYASAILEFAHPSHCVFVATDDASVVRELRDVLTDYRLVTTQSGHNGGYHQSRFNQLPPLRRRALTVQFLAEFEALRGADVFIGSHMTNVASFVNFHRGEERVVLL